MILPSVIGVSCFCCLEHRPRSFLSRIASALSSAAIFSGPEGTIFSATAKVNFTVNLPLLAACTLGIGVTGLSLIGMTVGLIDGVFFWVSEDPPPGVLAGLWLPGSGLNRLGIVGIRVLRLLGSASVGLGLYLDLDLDPDFLVT